MEQSLKERLVGAAVLVVLAVIFVPMVLDGPDAPSAAVPATLAAVPSGASTFRYDLNAPLSEQGVAPVAPVAAKPAPASTPVSKATPVVAAKSAASPPAEAAPAPKPEPAMSGSWAAQVGSFSKQATADSVAADLKVKGFKAFVMPHKDGKTTLYRVRVGPVTSRDAADALAKKITAKTGQAARPVQHP